MNHFIVLEGIDGVGKSTLSRMLVNRLALKGKTAVHLDDLHITSFLTNEQKRWAHEEASVEASLELFLASAAHKSTFIEAELARSCVVADRFDDSVWSHHLALGLSPSWLGQKANFGVLEPSATFHIVLPEGKRRRRLVKRGETNPADLESAGTGATLLGRKRIWFSRLIPKEVNNSKSYEDSLDLICSML